MTYFYMGIIFEKFRLYAACLVQINTKSIISSKEKIIVNIFILGLFIFMLGPALQAKFYIIEDHLLPEALSRDFLGWVTHIKNDITTFARVRPAYWIYIAIGNLLFGANPHLWHSATMLWGVLTSYLLYISIRKLGADVASSLIFILLLISATHGWIWVSLIPQETTGMGMAAIAVWAIILASHRKYVNQLNILSLASMALAGLIKESFVILIPALLLLRITCEKFFNNDESWWDCLYRLRGWISAGILIFMIEIMLVLTVLLAHPGGYSAGVSKLSTASFDPRKLLQLLSTLGLNEPLLLASGVWVGLWFTKKYDRSFLFAIAVILAAWLIPQLVLYINGLNDRYLFPGIVGIAVWISLGLSVLCVRFWWPIWILGLILLLPILDKGITSTITHISSFTAETQVSDRMIEFIAQNIPSDKTILMAVDSGTPYGFEATSSLPVYLRLAGSKSPFYLWPLLAKGARTEMHILASKNNTAFRYPDALTTNDIGAIIIVDRFTPGLDYTPLSQWLGVTAWREINFKAPYYTFSFHDLRYVEAGKCNYKILVSASTSDVPSDRPLIKVDHSLVDIISASPLLDFPPWGIERDYAGLGSIVWLGQGDKEGLGWVLSSKREQPITINLKMIPGPSRLDKKRSVELLQENGIGHYTQRAVSEGSQWKFDTKLQPGPNHFRLRILDEADIPIQPNGDTRRLLALLRHVTIH